MTSPTHIRATEYRCQDLLAEAARARLIKAATSAEPVIARPSSVSRVRASARRVLAMDSVLVALAIAAFLLFLVPAALLLLSGEVFGPDPIDDLGRAPRPVSLAEARDSEAPIAA